MSDELDKYKARIEEIILRCSKYHCPKKAECRTMDEYGRKAFQIKECFKCWDYFLLSIGWVEGDVLDDADVYKSNG